MHLGFLQSIACGNGLSCYRLGFGYPKISIIENHRYGNILEFLIGQSCEVPLSVFFLCKGIRYHRYSIKQILLSGGVVFHFQKSLLGEFLAFEVVFTKPPPIALMLKVWNFMGGFGKYQNLP